MYLRNQTNKCLLYVTLVAYILGVSTKEEKLGKKDEILNYRFMVYKL